MAHRRQHPQQQRGAALVLTALLLTAMLGIAALAVDQAVIDLAHQRAQTVADAAALAGGQELPNTASATQAANRIIAANNADGSAFVGSQITFPGAVTRDDGTSVTTGTGNAIQIQGETDAPISFGAAIGFLPTSQSGVSHTLSVSAQAAVILQASCTLPAGIGLAPFALIGDAPNNPDTTAQYVSSLVSTSGAQAPQPGQYQPTTTYDGQPIVLRLNVWNTDGTLAVPGNLDPVLLGGSQAYTSSINSLSTAPLTVGQSLTVAPNATIAITHDYLNARLASSNTAFTHDATGSQAYAAWFFGNPTYPADTSQTPVTDPSTGITYSYYLDPNRQALTDAHVLVVPVVSQSVQNGTGPVTVLAFAVFFVEQPYTQPTTNALAQGRFIGIILPGSSGGGCTAAGVSDAPQLVQ